MRAWATNKVPSRYQIPSETQWFAKLSLALETGEMDEAVWDRQRPAWIADLAEMAVARALPMVESAPAIELPGGVRFAPSTG